MQKTIQIADKPTLDTTKETVESNAEKLLELLTNVATGAGGGCKI